MEIGTRIIRAPRGSALSCKGWPQEAALRMLMNNLDPDVAERPDDLVVYGGSGKAARNWDAFDAIVNELRQGRLFPPVDSVFPLEHGAAAFQRLATGEQFGKIVVNIS